MLLHQSTEHAITNVILRKICEIVRPREYKCARFHSRVCAQWVHVSQLGSFSAWALSSGALVRKFFNEKMILVTRVMQLLIA